MTSIGYEEYRIINLTKNIPMNMQYVDYYIFKVNQYHVI